MKKSIALTLLALSMPWLIQCNKNIGAERSKEIIITADMEVRGERMDLLVREAAGGADAAVYASTK